MVNYLTSRWAEQFPVFFYRCKDANIARTVATLKGVDAVLVDIWLHEETYLLHHVLRHAAWVESSWQAGLSWNLCACLRLGNSLDPLLDFLLLYAGSQRLLVLVLVDDAVSVHLYRPSRLDKLCKDLDKRCL